MDDLNKVGLLSREGLMDTPLADNSCAGQSVSVYFRDIERALIEKINSQRCAAVFGAVAWLTSEPVIEALTKKQIAQIVVQKEDFLRPDGNSQCQAKKRLRAQYARISGTERYDHPCTALDLVAVCQDPTVIGVRCVGNHNRDQAVQPRMHNKFLVFASLNPEYLVAPRCTRIPRYVPYAVWTGSYNMSYTATRSFENAIYITDPAVVSAYYREWAQLAAISEPLDWHSEWVAPEWRLGT